MAVVTLAGRARRQPREVFRANLAANSRHALQPVCDDRITSREHELLLSSSGPPSAVDRVHTALSRLSSRTLCSPQRDYASDISTGYYGTFQGPADNRDIHSINSQPARRKGHTRSGSRH